MQWTMYEKIYFYLMWCAMKRNENNLLLEAAVKFSCPLSIVYLIQWKTSADPVNCSEFNKLVRDLSAANAFVFVYQVWEAHAHLIWATQSDRNKQTSLVNSLPFMDLKRCLKIWVGVFIEIINVFINNGTGCI